MKITGVIALLALLSAAIASVPVNRCALKMDPGPCRGAFPRWFFNPKTKKCTQFIWGGCQGVVPFETESECRAACENPCKLLPDPGLCEAAIESYFFNRKTKKCQKFIWGGCGGTRPFKTLEECKNRCVRKGKCDLTPKDVLPPPGTITCQLAQTSWYFNKFSGKCESFSYSSCSNLGPFKTKRKCVKAKCKCKLTPEDTKTGPVTCAAFWTTWFYNKKAKTCKKFSYSGCSPIGFPSKRRCIRKCK